MTRAIILAAGQGMRLRPITDDRPKALVPLFGKTLLERQLEKFRALGVERVSVLGGYRADRLAEYPVSVILNPRYETSNMVVSLFCAGDWMSSDEDLIISYGDIAYEPTVLKTLLASSSPVSVVVDRGWRAYWQQRMADPLADAETLKLGPELQLLEVGKKPKSYDEIQAQYIGLIKIRADQVGKLKTYYAGLDRGATYDGKSFDLMFMTSFIQGLIDGGWDVRAVPIEHGWVEVDAVTDLELYERLNSENRLRELFNPDA